MHQSLERMSSILLCYTIIIRIGDKFVNNFFYEIIGGFDCTMPSKISGVFNKAASQEFLKASQLMLFYAVTCSDETKRIQERNEVMYCAVTHFFLAYFFRYIVNF